MSTSPNDTSESLTPPDKSTVILLLGIAGDTTWRMFVPIIGLTSLGVWADNSYATKPWLTMAGIAVGVVLAALLVRNQLKKEPKT